MRFLLTFGTRECSFQILAEILRMSRTQLLDDAENVFKNTAFLIHMGHTPQVEKYGNLANIAKSQKNTEKSYSLTIHSLHTIHILQKWRVHCMLFQIQADVDPQMQQIKLDFKDVLCPSFSLTCYSTLR